MTLGEDIVDHKKFNEIAAISHSGNLARGHYTYFIKSASSSSSSSSSWFHCNDAAVIPSNETALNNDTYIFFYKNMSWEYEKIGRGELWVSECWSLQEFCIPALCISAGIFLTCTLAWIFKGTSHHWWPSSTSLEVTPLRYPGQQLSGVRGRNCCCSDLLSVSNVWQGCNNPTYDPSHI